MKRTLSAAFLFCLASAPVAAAAPDCAGADRKFCLLQAKLQYMPALASFLNGDAELSRRFADAAFNHGFEHEWLLFDSLLRGGRKDPDGRLIRSELSKLPPEQWYYVIRLEDHRRNLAGMGGGVYGNFVQGVGNMVRPEKDEMHSMKCFEQADTLIRNAAPIKDSARPRGAFNAWSALPVTAKFRKMNEHTAPCFRFDGPGGPVEIVADSWGDTLLPARAWWTEYDRDALAELSRFRGVCGQDYDDWDLRRIRALMQAEEESKKKWEKRAESLNLSF